jgi:hypothetical protein
MHRYIVLELARFSAIYLREKTENNLESNRILESMAWNFCSLDI